MSADCAVSTHKQGVAGTSAGTKYGRYGTEQHSPEDCKGGHRGARGGSICRAARRLLSLSSSLGGLLLGGLHTRLGILWAEAILGGHQLVHADGAAGDVRGGGDGGPGRCWRSVGDALLLARSPRGEE